MKPFVAQGFTDDVLTIAVTVPEQTMSASILFSALRERLNTAISIGNAVFIRGGF